MICKCGHGIDVHGFKDSASNLICPECGKECTMIDLQTGPDPEPFDELCECGHHLTDHQKDADYAWCQGCIHSAIPMAECCSAFTPAKTIGPVCICGHPETVHGQWDDTHLVEGKHCRSCLDNYEIPLDDICREFKTVGDTVTTQDFATVNKAALDIIKKDQPPSIPQPVGHNSYWNQQSFSPAYVKCDHAPFLAYKDKGAEIWIGTKSECRPAIAKGEFDILLNCANMGRVLPNHTIPLPGFKKYETLNTVEIQIDWPDMGTPVLAAMFWRDLLEYLRTNKKKMLAFCVGGHGRTGTAFACLLVAAGYKAREAKKWVWDNYCQRAIETDYQEKYIKSVEKGLK